MVLDYFVTLYPFFPGLGSILFAINIDSEELNSIKPATGLDTLVSMSAPTAPLLPSVPEPEPQPVIGSEPVDRGV